MMKTWNRANSILETIEASVVVLDTRGRIIYFNRGAQRLTGYEVAQVLGRVIWEVLVPKSDIGLVKQAFAGLLTDASPRRFESKWITREGRERLIAWSDAVVKNAQGKVTRVIFTGLDISDRREAEEALQESKELYRGVADLTEACVARFDLEGRRIFVNETLVKRRGRSAQEMLKGTFGDQMLPQDRVRAGRLFRQCVDTGKPVVAIVSEHEQDGRFYWTRANYTPVFAMDGKVVGVQSTAVDITELVEAQEHLQQVIADLEHLHDITREMITVLDMDRLLVLTCQSVLEASGAKMVWIGLLEEDGQELQPAAFCGDEDGYLSVTAAVQATQPGHHCIAATVGSKGPIINNRLQSRPPTHPWDQKARELGYGSSASFPLLFGDEVVGSLNVYCDTEDAFEDKRVAEGRMFADAAALAIRNARLYEEASSARAMARLSDMKSHLLSTVSHELCTPLATIKGCAKMTLDYGDRLPLSEKREYLQAIVDSSERLEEMVRDLLDMSRIEAGVLQIHKQPCSAGSLLKKVAARMRPHMRKHRLIVRVPEELPSIEADEMRVEQVLQNLLANAAQYSPDGGEIRLRAEARGPEILVSVSDQGIGIEKKELEAVFEPFYRIETGRPHETPGAGLGLAICKALVESHGGHIWVESEPGKGSTFYFALPRFDNELTKRRRDTEHKELCRTWRQRG